MCHLFETEHRKRFFHATFKDERITIVKDEKIVIDSEISERLYNARKHGVQKITQEELAYQADVEVSTIKRIEKCRKGRLYTTSIFTLAKIVDVLNVSIESILGSVYNERIEKWAAAVDRYRQLRNNDESWITFEGSGWEDRLDELSVSCNKYPVETLILAICAQGGELLVKNALDRYNTLS